MYTSSQCLRNKFLSPFISVFGELSFHILSTTFFLPFFFQWLPATFHLVLCFGFPGLILEHFSFDICCASFRDFLTSSDTLWCTYYVFFLLSLSCGERPCRQQSSCSIKQYQDRLPYFRSFPSSFEFHCFIFCLSFHPVHFFFNLS